MHCQHHSRLIKANQMLISIDWPVQDKSCLSFLFYFFHPFHGFHCKTKILMFRGHWGKKVRCKTWLLFLRTLPVFCHRSLLYLTGVFLRFSNSRELSCLERKTMRWNIGQHYKMLLKSCMAEGPLTTVNSFPAAFRNALVHLVFLGLRFFLKFLMHFDLQNLNV